MRLLADNATFKIETRQNEPGGFWVSVLSLGEWVEDVDRTVTKKRSWRRLAIHTSKRKWIAHHKAKKELKKLIKNDDSFRKPKDPKYRFYNEKGQQMSYHTGYP